MGGVLPPEEVEGLRWTLPGYEFDLEKAKPELAQSSYPDGFEIAVRARPPPDQINILERVAESLRQIGITRTCRRLIENQWLAGYFRHESLGLQIMSDYPAFADPVTIGSSSSRARMPSPDG